MSNGTVRKWVRAFKDGRTNVRDVERSERPSVITDDLVQKIDQTVRENSRFTITSLSDDFCQVCRSVELYNEEYDNFLSRIVTGDETYVWPIVQLNQNSI